MSVLNDLKFDYNVNLQRYYKGCEYCKKHKKEVDKWTPELLNILDNLNVLLEEIKQYESITEKQILEGF